MQFVLNCTLLNALCLFVYWGFVVEVSFCCYLVIYLLWTLTKCFHNKYCCIFKQMPKKINDNLTSLSKQGSSMHQESLPSLYFGMFATDTYRRTCHSPTAARFHPDHGIPPRWWNCSPLQEPLPLWAAEWCLRKQPHCQDVATRSDGMCHLPTERGGRGEACEWGAIQEACRKEI